MLLVHGFQGSALAAVFFGHIGNLVQLLVQRSAHRIKALYISRVNSQTRVVLVIQCPVKVLDFTGCCCGLCTCLAQILAQFAVL